MPDHSVVSVAEVRRCHDEVLSALVELAAESGIAASRGERVRADRRSEFRYCGVRTPDRRRRVAAGFSFTSDTAPNVLAMWDGIWSSTDHGDVLFAALDAYRSTLASASPVTIEVAAFWRVASHWVDRIDNWAHADDLARVYSHALEAEHALVYPKLLAWSLADNEWLRRVAVVSLIHYSGKNAVFLPAEPVLDLVRNCVEDRRESVSKAVGWVLRETMHAFPDDVCKFLADHASVMPAAAIRRATEHLDPAERDRLRDTLG